MSTSIHCPQACTHTYAYICQGTCTCTHTNKLSQLFSVAVIKIFSQIHLRKCLLSFQFQVTVLYFKRTQDGRPLKQSRTGLSTQCCFHSAQASTWSGAAHIQGEFSDINELLRKFLIGTAIGAPNLDNSSLWLPFQLNLGCVKLSIHNHHTSIFITQAPPLYTQNSTMTVFTELLNISTALLASTSQLGRGCKSGCQSRLR